MRLSKYIKANKDILIEYIYDDGNNISEKYEILVNIKDNSYSYMAGTGSITANTMGNQLFKIDGVTNNYGLVNSSNYNFLQIKDYASGFPIRNDIIKVHLPINYTFGEYLGFYIKVYTFDYNNQFTYNLSNFYFDATNVDQSYLLNYNAPAFLFNEKLWGKNVTINIPSTFAVANQRVNNNTKPNSVNFNLTNGTGLSLNSPIFIDFHFLTSKKTVNKVTTYYLNTRTPISLPQTPDFEKLGLKIEHSINGDYFEIYGTYNGNIAEFNNFIINSTQLGNRYYVTYTITLYEQNIRGKSFTITITENFNEKVEYRPIIKYSTTTAIIDVEMNLIDAVNDSAIYRKASYGMLQDEVSKYSINLTKINLANAHKPKIYNITSPQGAGIFGNAGLNLNMPSNPQVMLEPIKINYTVLADKYNVVAKSDNVTVGKTKFWGSGFLQLTLHSFDNVIQFIVAQEVNNDLKAVNAGNGSSFENVSAPVYMDMTNMGEIKMIIKNTQLSVETGLYMASNSVDLTKGQVVFKIPFSKMNDVRKIYDSGINVFYIVAKTDTGTTVIYSGLFVIYDAKDNVASLNNTLNQQIANANNDQQPTIISDPNSVVRGTATVTRKTSPSITATASNSTTTTTSSNPASTKVNGVTYTITSDSGLNIDGVKWTSGSIKEVLQLDSSPTNLTIKTDTLFSNDKLLDTLPSLKVKLENKYINTPDDKSLQNLIVNNFKNNPNSGLSQG